MTKLDNLIEKAIELDKIIPISIVGMPIKEFLREFNEIGNLELIEFINLKKKEYEEITSTILPTNLNWL